MTIVCEHHEHSDCLTLTDGVLEVREGELVHAKLEYRCEIHDLTGTLTLWGQVPEITGALTLAEPDETLIDDHRGIEQ